MDATDGAYEIAVAILNNFPLSLPTPDELDTGCSGGSTEGAFNVRYGTRAFLVRVTELEE